MLNKFNHSPIYLLLAIVATAVVIFPTLLNGWTNWDDHYYVFNNQMIQGLSLEKLKWIFTNQYNGNYAPLVLLSFALDFAVWGTDPFGYHLTNYLLHLLNVSLAFLWFKKLTNSNWQATLVALLFGIHPLHLEPVAWISARKDLLYALFLLAGFYTWTVYISQKAISKELFIATTTLLCLSVLSKGLAVMIPLFLLVIDYWFGRKDYKKMILEKVPFLVLSLVFGLVSIKAQQQTTALNEVSQIDFLQSSMYGFHALFLYLIKAIVPFHIGPFHPYPSNSSSQLLVICSGITAVVILLIVFAYGWVKQNKMILGGVAFLTIGLLPILQFLPVGFAIFADRYTYIPYLGMFIIVLEMVIQVMRNRRAQTVQIIGFSLVVYVGCLGLVSFQNSTVWKNDKTLWSKVIKDHPNDARAYVNRGMHYAKIGDIEQAQFDFENALQRNPDLKELHQQRGLLFQQTKNWSQAERSFQWALEIDKMYPPAMLNLALNFNYQKQKDSCYFYLERLETINPTYLLLYLNRGVIAESDGKLKLAENDYSKAISFHPLDYRGYQFRGVIRYKQGLYERALQDFLVWQNLAKSDAKAQRWLARACFELREFDNAQYYAQKAEQLGGALDAEFIELLNQKTYH